jgi:hypothetical protein
MVSMAAAVAVVRRRRSRRRRRRRRRPIQSPRQLTPYEQILMDGLTTVLALISQGPVR